MEKNTNLTEDILQTNTINQTGDKYRSGNTIIDALMLITIGVIGILAKFVVEDSISLFLCAIALICVGVLWVLLIYRK